MTDQTIKADAGKPCLALVPRQIIRDIAEVREYGNRKYGDLCEMEAKILRPKENAN